MFALVDCNNFYASCERLFRPDLHNKPILVLSNNDGCVIARSNEAKALGIGMGEPYFKVKSLCNQYQVHIFSSNFMLYGDLSARVMSVIEDSWPHCEIYSIDEAFIDLSTLPVAQHEVFCEQLQKRILKETGIPTSIGIGRTKTLAKIANFIAKKELKTPVFNICNQFEWLNRLPVNEVWGIGRQLHRHLLHMGIYTVADLAAADKQLLKNKFSVVVMRTAMELAGIPCNGLDVREARKSILASRSFGTMITEFSELSEAVSMHCARAYEKLRSEKQLVRHMQVFVRTNRFRDDLAQHNVTMDFNLINPTDDLRCLTSLAKQGLKKIFKQGYYYKKAGVCFNDLISRDSVQLDLFNQPDEEKLAHKDRLMNAMDAINQRYGRKAIALAAQNFNPRWAAHSDLRSPCYTTRWSELALINT